MSDELAPYQKRAIEEQYELGSRLAKLAGFIDSNDFRELPIEDRDLIRAQYGHMLGYNDALKQRIERFSNESP